MANKKIVGLSGKLSDTGESLACAWRRSILDRKLKVLITDDSKLLRMKLRDELEQLDCEVVEADSGGDCLKCHSRIAHGTNHLEGGIKVE